VHVDFDAVLRVDDEPLERFPMRLGQCKRFDLISPKSKAAFAACFSGLPSPGTKRQPNDAYDGFTLRAGGLRFACTRSLAGGHGGDVSTHLMIDYHLRSRRYSRKQLISLSGGRSPCRAAASC
jgi:hypothetical protein